MCRSGPAWTIPGLRQNHSGFYRGVVVSSKAYSILVKMAAVGVYALILGSLGVMLLPHVLWGIVVVLAYTLLIPSGVVLVFVIPLILLGYLRIKCPLCGKPGEMVGRGSYSWLNCARCGSVHERGFFRCEYYVDNDYP